MALMVSVVPDEDPEREPTVHIPSRNQQAVPFEVMHWFMEKVAEQVKRCPTGDVTYSTVANGPVWVGMGWCEERFELAGLLVG